jgi:hypothetical protein
MPARPIASGLYIAFAPVTAFVDARHLTHLDLDLRGVAMKVRSACSAAFGEASPLPQYREDADDAGAASFALADSVSHGAGAGDSAGSFEIERCGGKFLCRR